MKCGHSVLFAAHSRFTILNVLGQSILVPKHVYYIYITMFITLLIQYIISYIIQYNIYNIIYYIQYI